MIKIATFLRDRRILLGLKVSEISRLSRIDQALISKYENGSRIPSDKHLVQLAEAYQIAYLELRKLWVVEKVVALVYSENEPADILHAAETRMEYLTSGESTHAVSISKEISEKLELIDSLQKEWHKNRPLNALQLEKMKEYFNIQYTFESNQIEGNTLTLQETMLVVSEGITISGKSMREHLEAVNHAHAIDYIGELVGGSIDFNRRSLLEIHSLILKSIDQQYAGRFRDVPVRISGSAHEPPQPFLIEKLMEDYFAFYTRNKKVLHPVIMAAELHERLVSIHPFIDGNGRTSRLVMNFHLLQNGYTVTSLKGDLNSRLEYYRSLEACQLDNGNELFYQLIVDRVIHSLSEHLSMI